MGQEEISWNYSKFENSLPAEKFIKFHGEIEIFVSHNNDTTEALLREITLPC